MSHDQREGRQPASRAIVEAIRSRIEPGELSPGARLLSERHLAITYGAARNAAREAVRILSDAGLVITDQGNGSFVRPQTPLIRLGSNNWCSPRHRDTGLSPFLLECPSGARPAASKSEHRPDAAAARGGRAARRGR